VLIGFVSFYENEQNKANVTGDFSLGKEQEWCDGESGRERGAVCMVLSGNCTLPPASSSPSW
jgi:hypothetical protein